MVQTLDGPISELLFLSTVLDLTCLGFSLNPSPWWRLFCSCSRTCGSDVSAWRCAPCEETLVPVVVRGLRRMVFGVCYPSFHNGCFKGGAL
jgi:hypothetical protein